MGRFDALTQIDKRPRNSVSVSEKTIPPQSQAVSKNQFASKPANQQTNKEANQQRSLSASLPISKLAKKQVSLPANQQTSKQLKKFGSYLTEESLKALKRIAFDTERKDYEVLQEAVDQYLQNHKQ